MGIFYIPAGKSQPRQQTILLDLTITHGYTEIIKQQEIEVNRRTFTFIADESRTKDFDRQDAVVMRACAIIALALVAMVAAGWLK